MFTTEIIIILSVLLLLSIVTPLINPLLRLPKKQEDDVDSSENTLQHENISIVISAHDNGPQLRHSLELFLNQDYPGEYEVIVVTDEKDSETDDVIKLYSSNPRLYATFMPLTSRYLSRKKLAITLGIKAAHYDWVVVTDGYCRPTDNNWLKAFASRITKDKDLILGHTIYDEHAPSVYQFEHLHHSLYTLKKANTNNAVSINSPFIAIRKEVFMRENGFLGNLQFVRGEYSFLVNKYASKNNNTLSISPKAILIEETPYKRRWRNKHLYHLNTYRHLRHYLPVSLLYLIDMLAMHLCNITIILAIVYSVLTENWLVTGIAIACFLIEYVIRTIIGNRAIKRFGLHINPVMIPLLEFTQTFRNISYHLRYMMADKNNFKTHKL